MEQNGNQTGEFSHSKGGKPPQKGRPTRRRDFNRLNKFNEEKAGTDWANQKDVEDKYSQRIQGNTAMWKPQPSHDKRGPPPSRTMKNVVPSNVFDIDMFLGAEPTHARYCQNLEHGVFDVLMDQSHEHIRQVDSTFSRKVPLVEYRHYNTMLLNAKLIDIDRKQNHALTLSQEGDVTDLFPSDIAIHQPLYEYLSNIGECITPSGDHIQVNLPTGGIPQLAIAAEGDYPAIDSGSFGRITAANHNAYECYISPLVTRRAIEIQRENVVNNEWQPLPVNAFPAGALPNRNLLGWVPIYPIHRDAIETLHRVTFQTNTNLQSRLQYSGHIVSQVNLNLRDLSVGMKPKIKVGLGIPPTKTSISTTGVLVTTDAVEGDLRVASASVQHPYVATISLTKQVGLIGMKRHRYERACGLSYTIAGAAPADWTASRNNNYNMVEPFLPVRTVDDPSLRVLKFRDFGPQCTRDVLLSDWIKTKCSI